MRIDLKIKESGDAKAEGGRLIMKKKKCARIWPGVITGRTWHLLFENSKSLGRGSVRISGSTSSA